MFTVQAYNEVMTGNQQLKFNYEAIVPVSIQVPRQPDPAQLHQKFTKILISLNLRREVRSKQ